MCASRGQHLSSSALLSGMQRACLIVDGRGACRSCNTRNLRSSEFRFGLPEGPHWLELDAKSRNRTCRSPASGSPLFCREARCEALTGKHWRCSRPSFAMDDIKREPVYRALPPLPSIGGWMGTINKEPLWTAGEHQLPPSRTCQPERLPSYGKN
jgi:hypothetical protein